MEGVVLRGAQWCGDGRRAPSLLKGAASSLADIDLEAEPGLGETVMWHNDGRRDIPVVVFADDSHLTELASRASLRSLDLGPVPRRCR